MKSGHSIIQNSQCPSANQKLPHLWGRKEWLIAKTKQQIVDLEMAETMELAYLGHLKIKYIKRVLNKVFKNLFLNVTWKDESYFKK